MPRDSRQARNAAGFTLLELVVVLALVAAFFAVALPPSVGSGAEGIDRLVEELGRAARDAARSGRPVGAAISPLDGSLIVYALPGANVEGEEIQRVKLSELRMEVVHGGTVVFHPDGRANGSLMLELDSGRRVEVSVHPWLGTALVRELPRLCADRVGRRTPGCLGDGDRAVDGHD